MKKHISDYEFMSEDIEGISAILESLGVVIANSDDYYTNEQKALNLLSHQLQDIAKKCDEIVEITYDLAKENSQLKEKISRYEINEDFIKAFQTGLKPKEANNG